MKRASRLLFVTAALSLAVSSLGAAQAMRAGFNANALAGNDDFWVTPRTAFGFTLNFFGVNYTSGWLNNNGNISFGLNGMGTYTPGAITGGSTPMIAPFWADVDTRSGPLMQYGSGTVGTRNAFGVTWSGVCYFAVHCDKTNEFQLVLIDRSDVAAGDFDIEFNYGSIQWEAGDASSATNGLCNGVPDYPATAGFTNGLGGYYQLPGSGVCGAFLDGGVNALRTHSYNSNVAGRYLFNVRNGTTPEVVPEPVSMVLLGTGLFGVAAARRRKKDEQDLG